MDNSHILLLFPPGWPLNIGGPHIALSILKGYLQANNVPVLIRDINQEVCDYLKLRIDKTEVEKACSEISLSNLNMPYYKIQNEINDIGERFNGNWDIQDGFNFNNCNQNSSKSINPPGSPVAARNAVFSV